MDAAGSEPGKSFSRKEWEAIQVHRYYLSQHLGRYVSIEECVRSWLSHHSRYWREEQMKKSWEAQLREIMKHKWIESEKAGCDVGKTSVMEWIDKYASTWRKCWQEEEKKDREFKAGDSG